MILRFGFNRPFNNKLPFKPSGPPIQPGAGGYSLVVKTGGIKQKIESLKTSMASLPNQSSCIPDMGKAEGVAKGAKEIFVGQNALAGEADAEYFLLALRAADLCLKYQRIDDAQSLVSAVAISFENIDDCNERANVEFMYHYLMAETYLMTGKPLLAGKILTEDCWKTAKEQKNTDKKAEHLIKIADLLAKTLNDIDLENFRAGIAEDIKSILADAIKGLSISVFSQRDRIQEIGLFLLRLGMRDDALVMVSTSCRSITYSRLALSGNSEELEKARLEAIKGIFPQFVERYRSGR